jgi:BirA family transcriptional regulator, biotin operon repressor / biotin---[acetyl-CoA-carboxylase] ligase
MSHRYSIHNLRPRLKPFRLIWFPTVGSTNTKAAAMRRAGKLLAPAIVLTGRQSAGRGRGSNTWSAPPGVMTVTFVLPVNDQIQPHHVPLIAGLAVKEALVDLGVPDCGLKWPNDLWAPGDLKVAGLLCERVDGIDLVGIGVNVSCDRTQLPASVRAKSTTLSELSQRAITMDETLLALARQLTAHLLRPRFSVQTFLSRYAESLVLKGRKIRVTDPGVNIEGVCEGIDAAGRLVLRNNSGRHVILSGRVSAVP